MKVKTSRCTSFVLRGYNVRFARIPSFYSFCSLYFFRILEFRVQAASYRLTGEVAFRVGSSVLFSILPDFVPYPTGLLALVERGLKSCVHGCYFPLCSVVDQWLWFVFCCVGLYKLWLSLAPWNEFFLYSVVYCSSFWRSNLKRWPSLISSVCSTS